MLARRVAVPPSCARASAVGARVSVPPIVVLLRYLLEDTFSKMSKTQIQKMKCLKIKELFRVSPTNRPDT